MEKVTRFILFEVFLLAGLTVNGQDEGIYAILQRGSAAITNNMTKQTVQLSQKKIDRIGPYSKLSLDINSTVIVYNHQGFEQLGGKKEESYHVREIARILAKKENESAAKRFLEYMNYTYSEIHKNELKKGSVVGAATRGTDDKDFFYLPGDSMIVLSDTVRLRWGPESQFMLQGLILVVNTSKGDTVYNSRPGKNELFLENLSDGTYIWTGRFRSKDGKNISMRNLFYIPEESLRKQYLKDLADFNTLIEHLDDETRMGLTSDYLYFRKIFSH